MKPAYSWLSIHDKPKTSYRTLTVYTKVFHLENKWAYGGYSTNTPRLLCLDSKQTVLHTGTHTDVNTHSCTCALAMAKNGSWMLSVRGKEKCCTSYQPPPLHTATLHIDQRTHTPHTHTSSLCSGSHTAHTQQHFLASTLHTFTLFSSWPTPWQHAIELRWGRWRWSGQFSAFPARISIATLYCLHCLPQ